MTACDLAAVIERDRTSGTDRSRVYRGCNDPRPTGDVRMEK
jgi:hypothetical protein